MKYTIALVTLWCLLLSRPMQAQQKIYTLADIWQKTLRQYPSLSSKAYQVKQQQLNKELVNKERLPEVNIQSQASYGSYQGVSGAFFPLSGIYNVSGNGKLPNESTGSIGNVYTSAVLQWNFLQFGKLKSKLKVADAAVDVSTAELNNEQFQLQRAAAGLYFTVLKSAALLSVNEVDVKRLHDLFEMAKTQAHAGLRPGADTLLIKSTFYQLKGTVNEQRARFETAMLQLASLIGEEATSFAIDTAIYKKLPPSALPAVADSLNKHPYLRYLKSNISYKKASLEAVSKLPYPSAGLLAGTGTRGSGIGRDGMVNNRFTSPWKNNSPGYLVGVGITWNLSTLFQNKVKQQIAETEIAYAKEDYKEANLQLKTAYQAAVSSWKQQSEKVADSRVALDASQQAYGLYVTRYESGLINLIELLQLQKTLQEAENNFVQARGDYWDEMMNQSVSAGNLSILSALLNP